MVVDHKEQMYKSWEVRRRILQSAQRFGSFRAEQAVNLPVSGGHQAALGEQSRGLLLPQPAAWHKFLCKAIVEGGDKQNET